MATPAFTCDVSADDKAKFLGLTLEPLARESTNVAPISPASSSEDEKGHKRARGDDLKDTALAQIQEMYQEAQDKMTKEMCRALLKTLPQYACRCESCHADFETWNEGFTVCEKCEDLADE